MIGHPRETDKELKEYLRRAERHPDKTGNVRRDAFRRLLALAHSEDNGHKKLATEKIKDYFNDFPALQDEAINTIYDLCEDPSSTVRIAGYEAIASVSRVDKAWLVRNADVLIQLLQSDEKDEVAVVQKALLEHIDMDPPSVLQVLCDQCGFDADRLDSDEIALRTRLRTLVLQFLSEKATRTIERVTRVPGGDAERALFNGLIPAIPKSTLGELEMIVTRIFPLLPSLRVRGTNGDAVLSAVLERTSAAIKDDLHAASGLSDLPTVRIYLDLAAQVVLRDKAADPLQLIKFYLTSGLVSKITLQKLNEDARLVVISGIADAWRLCEEMLHNNGTSERTDLLAARTQLVDASPIMFEFLSKSGLTDQRSCSACATLLNACKGRAADSSWLVPNHLSKAVQELLAITAPQQNAPEGFRTIQILCRSLLEQMPKPQPQPPPKASSSHPSSDTNNPKGSVASSSTQPQAIGKRRFGDEQKESKSRPADMTKPHLRNEVGEADPSGSHIRKKVRREASGTPSLLSRLEGSASSAASLNNRPVVANGQGRAQHSGSFDLPPPPLSVAPSRSPTPSAGFNELRIRGAALVDQPVTLLERMGQGVDMTSSRAQSSNPGEGRNGGGGQRWQRRRGQDRIV